MAWCLAALLLLAASVDHAGAARLSTDLEALSGDEEWKERPIAKVVKLLNDMKTQLEVESKEDGEMYDQMACWCETNDKDKTKSIADAQAKIKALASTIESADAATKTLQTEIKALEASIAESTKALEEADEIRAKELAEFNAEEKDAIQSIGGLKGAINSLSKANAGSALDQQQALIQVQEVLRRQPAAVAAAVPPHQRAEVSAFLNQGGMSLIQEGASLRAKQPASGAIFGMLGQMKESFEINMEASAKEEQQSAAEYSSLKAAKTSEVAAAQGKVQTKSTELATAKETSARSKENLDDTEDALAADTEFLGNLKKQCASLDAEFEARKKSRAEEVLGVSETIEILTSDEANDAMTKSMSLVQARSQSRREAAQREATAKFLAGAGQRLRSPRLSYLAVRVRIDAFAKVKENIGKMVKQLGKEQKDEVVKKDDCNTDLNTNEKQTSEKNVNKEDVETEINTLDSEISMITDEENQLREQIAAAQIELKKAGENRETENKDFQESIQDQRATQAILDKALKRMQEVYKAKAAAAASSLLQVSSHRTAQEPPVQFGKMEKNEGGGGVITMLQGIIDESKAVEQEAKSAETDAMMAYDQFVKDTNKQIEALSRQLVADDEVLAQDTAKEVDDKTDKANTVQDLLKLGEVSTTLHGACDFTLKNFGTRQHARADEMDALKESEVIFGGAASSLMQASAQQ